MATEKLYAGILRHDGTGEIREVFYGDYQAVVQKLGRIWKRSYDLGFDPKLKNPFFDPDPESDDVEVFKQRGRICSVTHAGGDGPVIDIVPARSAVPVKRAAKKLVPFTGKKAKRN